MVVAASACAFRGKGNIRCVEYPSQQVWLAWCNRDRVAMDHERCRVEREAEGRQGEVKVEGD